ncbi:hypothetical protein LINPERHAP2_LOCUS15838 [Linum perenne]
MLKGARSSIGDGLETKFWTDRWTDGGVRLIDLVSRDNLPEDTDAMVAELVNEDGLWDLDLISQYLPQMLSIVSRTCPPHDRIEGKTAGAGELSSLVSSRSDPRISLFWITMSSLLPNLGSLFGNGVVLIELGTFSGLQNMAGCLQIVNEGEDTWLMTLAAVCAIILKRI